MEHDWVKIGEGLPDLIPGRLISRTVLFEVEGQCYAGHYHNNGWFYCDEQSVNRGDFFNALGRSNASRSIVRTDHQTTDQVVTKWRYLR